MCFLRGHSAYYKDKNMGTLNAANGPVIMTVYIQFVFVCVCVLFCNYSQNIKTIPADAI